MGMFQQTTTKEGRRLTKPEMVDKVRGCGTPCGCGTFPHEHVFIQYRQVVHCPRCGRQPYNFQNGGKK